MVDKVLRTLHHKCGVRKGDRIIVALSGGADSVSLLYALHTVSRDEDIILMAAHVNHNLRGEESDRDENFVRKLCNELGIELFVHSEDVNALAEKEHKSIELCGRDVRYRFFASLARTHCAFVATAHTLSDAQETMLYNIARGTTLHGICSIPYKRDYIIRPLLDVTREDVESFCSANSLEFVQDSTNFQEEVCVRNKIRLSVMPQLRSLNGGFNQNFARLREDLQSVDDFLLQSAKSAVETSECDFGFESSKLLDHHKAVINYALMLIISQSGAKAEYNHITKCADILLSGGAVPLIGGFTAVCKQGIFRIVPAESSEDFTPIPLKNGARFFYNGNEYSVKEISAEEIINKKLASFCVDCANISDDTVIRTRGEGDTFTIRERGLTKPLRKLQNELKIPAEKRGSCLVIATGTTVLWAENIGTSAQGTINKNSDKVFFIEIRRGE